MRYDLKLPSKLLREESAWQRALKRFKQHLQRLLRLIEGLSNSRSFDRKALYMQIDIR